MGCVVSSEQKHSDWQNRPNPRPPADSPPINNSTNSFNDHIQSQHQPQYQTQFLHSKSSSHSYHSHPSYRKQSISFGDDETPLTLDDFHFYHQVCYLFYITLQSFSIPLQYNNISL